MSTYSFTLHFLLHAGDLVDDRLRQRLAAIGMRPRQARIIDGLARMEPASQVALARAFDVTPASMSTMTARLIEAGYVTREADPNEVRANMLRLTERGRGLLSDIHSAWRDIDRLIEDRLGVERAAQLTELTRALRDGLGGRMPGTRVDETTDT